MPYRKTLKSLIIRVNKKTGFALHSIHNVFLTSLMLDTQALLPYPHKDLVHEYYILRR
jgi:hypothetical protein